MLGSGASDGRDAQIGSIGFGAYEVRSRRDVVEKYRARLREEAPYAYKDITPVVQTVEDAGVARRVARLAPLLTIKG